MTENAVVHNYPKAIMAVLDRSFRLLPWWSAVVFGLLFAGFLSLGTAQAQSVTVRIDDATVSPGETATIPIRVSNLENADDVTAYGFDIEFDDTAISYAGFEDANTLSDDADFTVDDNPDVPRIGAFSATAMNSVADGGIMLKIKLTVEASGEHSVTLTNFEFNEGSPAADPAKPSFILSGSTLQVNEVLPVPPQGSDGDANGDGTTDASEDEFVEVFNTSTSSSVDLSGWSVDVGSSKRQIDIPDGTVLDPEEALTVFGGGDPTDIPGVVLTASGGLSLADDGFTLRLLDDAGAQVLAFRYDGDVQGESLVRAPNPDFTGEFVPHTDVNSSLLFSPGKTASGDPLPVELAGLQAQAVDGDVSLKWHTASETNNAGFEVQHKKPGATQYRKAGFVDGAGTTNQSQTYRYQLDDLDFGTHSFRLRQVDTDGSSHLSEAVDLTIQMDERLYLQAPAPNPLRSNATIRFGVKTTQQTTLALYNSLGQRVATLYQGTPSGGQVQTVQFDAGSLSSGRYYLRLRSAEDTRTRSLTIFR